MTKLLLAPLRAEHAILASVLKQRFKHELIQKGGAEALYFPDVKTYLAIGGHGKVDMALHTQFWLTNLPCTALACVGSAGSLQSNLKVGDIVVGEKTVEHDFKQSFGAKTLPSFPVHKQWEDLLKKPSAHVPHWGVIASGDEDILSPERRLNVLALTKALAVAWEGAGAARACAFLNIPFCEIRGITDDPTTDLKQDFTKNIKQAMLNIANWLVPLL